MSNVLEEMNSLASQFKANDQPATDQDFTAFVSEMSGYGVSNPAIPDHLKTLWKIASEWHLIEDNYNVFGFNIYGPKNIVQVTKNVFGDEDIRKEWATDNGNESCGGTDWLCLAGYDEYNYIFMNFNKQSDLFGSTRHMVNNCNEDNDLTKPPFSNFIEYVKGHIENFKENSEEEDL
ncbi:hypothetical protein K7432_018017 [Basidiobolus ranarum]|uniref:Knr4/Smi1-like domain-containing protein n=1 Tax=Basidiobolus ranarum TaxID=34480 RepID=A0ABR2WCN6_9FUNG